MQVGSRTQGDRRRVRLVLCLGLISTFVPVSIDTYVLALPSIADDLEASTVSVQTTVSATLLGIGLGQLLVGPLSDVYGRRRPLLIGIALYAAATTLCALAPNVWALICLRGVMGACACAGLVVGRAVVRDLHAGAAAARLLATMMLLMALVPLLAPLIAAQLLTLGGWRLIFVALSVLGVVSFVVVGLVLPETLPPERRTARGVVPQLRVFGGLLRDRYFLACVAVLGFGISAIYLYFAAGSFVLQRDYGLSAGQFAVFFSVCGLGVVSASQISRTLVHVVGPRRLVLAGVSLTSSAGAGLVVIESLGGWLPGVLVCLCMVMASGGLITPSMTALALTPYPDRAGTAAALLGSFQYGVASVCVPLVGVFGDDLAMSMSVGIAACGLLALLAFSRTARVPAAPAL